MSTLDDARETVRDGDAAQDEFMERLGTLHPDDLVGTTLIVIGKMQAQYQKAIALALIDIAGSIDDYLYRKDQP